MCACVPMCVCVCVRERERERERERDPEPERLRDPEPETSSCRPELGQSQSLVTRRCLPTASLATPPLCVSRKTGLVIQSAGWLGGGRRLQVESTGTPRHLTTRPSTLSLSALAKFHWHMKAILFLHDSLLHLFCFDFTNPLQPTMQVTTLSNQKTTTTKTLQFPPDIFLFFLHLNSNCHQKKSLLSTWE